MLLQIMVNSQQTSDLISEAFQNGVILGLIIGLFGLSFFLLLYLAMKKASLKRYILYADEGTKSDVMEGIRKLKDGAEVLAMKTNTTYFKSLANEFHSLIAFIKKRNIG